MSCLILLNAVGVIRYLYPIALDFELGWPALYSFLITPLEAPDGSGTRGASCEGLMRSLYFVHAFGAFIFSYSLISPPCVHTSSLGLGCFLVALDFCFPNRLCFMARRFPLSAWLASSELVSLPLAFRPASLTCSVTQIAFAWVLSHICLCTIDG